ncbi:hypothetical protein Droror1_Dr00017554 [Drosera rotundifolia]
MLFTSTVLGKVKATTSCGWTPAARKREAAASISSCIRRRRSHGEWRISPLSVSVIRHHGIVSVEASFPQFLQSKKKKTAIQAFKDNKQELPYEALMGGFILEKIASPKSKGELSLINTKANDNPLVTFNYFRHPLDLKRCVEGIRVVEKIVKSKPFINYTRLGKASIDRLLNMSAQANVNLIPRHTNDTSSQ